MYIIYLYLYLFIKSSICKHYISILILKIFNLMHCCSSSSCVGEVGDLQPGALHRGLPRGELLPPQVLRRPLQGLADVKDAVHLLVMSFISYHIILYCITVYYIISYHIISYYIILYYIILCYIKYHIILCYIIIDLCRHCLHFIDLSKSRSGGPSTRRSWPPRTPRLKPQAVSRSWPSPWCSSRRP